MRPSSPNKIAAMGGPLEIVKPDKPLIFHHYQIYARIDSLINTVHLIWFEHPRQRTSQVGVSRGTAEGNLADALRTSMSIPTVFSPVIIDSLLLADGGMVRNYPVQECLFLLSYLMLSPHRYELIASHTN